MVPAPRRGAGRPRLDRPRADVAFVQDGQKNDSYPSRMNIKFATLNLEVRDVWRSVAFYTRVLGMQIDGGRSHPPTFAYLNSSGCALTLTTLHEAEAPEPSRTVEFGYETDDLAGFKERLAPLGITEVSTRTMDWGNAIELKDPDGHRVIVYEFKHE